MTTKNKAKELIEKMLPNMYCYMGSGFLTGDYDYSVALYNAQRCAMYSVDAVLETLESMCVNFDIIAKEEFDYWNEVKSEINLYNKELDE